MKKHAVLHLAFLLVFFSYFGIVWASASGYSCYDTTTVTLDERNKQLENMEYISSLESNPISEAISYFAISEQGQIALGFNDSAYASVHVYDVAGNFLYGYRFKNNESAYSLFFEGEDLSIIWVGEEYVGSFDPNGNCIRFRKDLCTKNNADERYKNRTRKASGAIGTLTYHIQKPGNMSFCTYSAFSVEDSDGNVTVIYDAKSEVLIRNLLKCTGLLIFGCIIGYIVINHNRHKQQEDKA